MTELRTVDYFRGDTEPIGFRVRDANNVLQNITGRTYRLGISRVRHPQATEAAAALVASIVGIILDGPNGLVGFQPANTLFDMVSPREYVEGVAHFFYDLEQTNGGVVQTLGSGRFELHQDISK